MSKLIEKGDRLVRKILLKLADGYSVRCVTCQTIGEAKNFQVGHWIGRSKLAVRFDDKNVSLQCQSCNYWYNGRPAEFERVLRSTHGDEAIDKMVLRSNQRLEPGELEQIIQTLEEKWQRLTNQS